MACHRFLVPILPNEGTVDLPTNEAHHASRVLRCLKGNSIILFDGKGNEAKATIQSIDKRTVVAAINSSLFAPRDFSGRLHFAIAMPKGDRQRNTVEKLVELGVDSLSPLTTSRSVAVVNDDNSERLERYVVEACKQCGRNRLMNIHSTLHIDEIRVFADSVASDFEANPTAIWILHPKIEGQISHTIHQANSIAQQSQKLLFLVGPEGGFTDDEVIQAVGQGARILSLGERIQRVETAASTAAVLGTCWLEERN